MTIALASIAVWRTLDAPNPILPQRTLKPKLQRRAPRSLERATCPRVIARSYPGIKPHALECDLRSTTKNFEEFREVVAHLERLVNEGTPLPRRRGRAQVLLARRLRPRVSESTGEYAASQEPDDPSEGSSTDRAPTDGHHRAIEVSEGISLEFKEELGVCWLQYEQNFLFAGGSTRNVRRPS